MSYIGPEVPDDILISRAKRRTAQRKQQSRTESAQVESSEENDDFAGPSLDDFNKGDTAEDEKAARERLLQVRIAKLRKERDNRVESENDLKHDSWMSMKPDWAQGSNQNDEEQIIRERSINKNTKLTNVPNPSISKKSLRETYLQGQLNNQDSVKYDSNESLNAEVRQEILRKASNMNDKFTRGS